MKENIVIGTSKEKGNFQWEILYFSGDNEKEILNIWNNLLLNNKILSCFCKEDYFKLAEILNFNKIENGYSYFPFGVLYRIDDLDDNSFYIGETTDKDKWHNGYMGSGSKWENHKKKYPPVEIDPDNPNAHHYKRTVLKNNFKSPRELYDAEVEELLKYSKLFEDGKLRIYHEKCMNTKTSSQYSSYPCPECGLICSHKSWCSSYTSPSICKECNGKKGHHKKGCSKYNSKRICSECGCDGFHKKDCSKFKKTVCQECGYGHGNHKKTCSKYKSPKPCSECGVIKGHLKTCSKFSRNNVCNECGVKQNHHKKTCSKYKTIEPCQECNGLDGKHKKNCPKYRDKEPCKECGSIGSSHYSTCSKFKKIKTPIPCPECGGKKGHFKFCSKYFKNRNKVI